MRRVPILALTAAMMMGLFSTTFSNSASAATGGSTVGPIDFEDYNLGDVNGQQGWMKTGPYDVAVAKVDAFDAADDYGFGEKALRASNANASGGFGDHTFSPGLAEAAGEGGLANFTASFQIGTAKPHHEPNLSMWVSPDDGTGGRLSFLRFVDKTDGVHVLFNEAVNGGPAGLTSTFAEHDIATLDHGHSYMVEFEIAFAPGAGNDVVRIYIDDVLKAAGKSWEDYYRTTTAPVPPTSKLLFQFRDNQPTAPDAEGKGFLVDEVSLESSKIMPARNPDLQGACGLNFVLVLDRSGSVKPSQDEVRDAANAFLDALVDTGSSVSLVSFAEKATVDAEPTPLTGGANLTLLKAKIGGLHFSGATNWDDALVKADSQLDAFGDGPAPMVVMITDGNPNKWGAGPTQGSGSGFVQEALDQAVAKANHIKTDGDHHMFAFGISGGNDPLNPGALRAISGRDEYPNPHHQVFGQTDWTQIDDFKDLKTRLIDIATDLCGGTVIIQKLVNAQAAGGWDFNATNADDSTGKTDDEGFVSFEMEDSGNAVETEIYEDQQPGYGLDDVVCMNGDDEVGTKLNNKDGVALEVGPRDIIKCQFDNRTLPLGAIAVAKSVDQPTVRSGATVTYSYSVTNPGNVELKDVAVTDDKCSPLALTGGDANDDKMLNVDETWVYTCSMAITDDTTNTATATGKTPWGENVLPFHDTITVDVIGPAITLVKNAPTRAHTGDRVTYGFTVTNTGDTGLENITVTDNVLGAIGVVAALAAGESATLNKDYVVLADQLADVVNQGSACAAGATDAAGAPLCATGEHTLDVLHPAITIDKTANPLNVTVPNPVTFTYVVKNTGDTPLSSLVVTDDKLGTITTGAIGAGETQTFTKTINASGTTPPQNIGTATGVDPLGRTVTASDRADIKVTEVLGVTLTQPAALPITGSGLRILLLGIAIVLTGGLLLTAARRRRTT